MQDSRPAQSSASDTSAEFLEKLRSALRRDGDFPANAKLVSELRMLVSDPKTTANQVTELILKEPSLGTRVLHLVNSSFYRRAKPIMTVSQAVIQIGMRPLAELCAGLVLLQKFIPAARRGGPFASCLQRTIITSLLTSSFSSNLAGAFTPSKSDETGYLAGSFFELGTLLLAYYFPQVYETALKRAESKKQDLGKSIEEIVGLSPTDLSLEVINALNLPDYYRQALNEVKQVSAAPSAPVEGASAQRRLAQALFAGQKISTVLVHSKSKQELDSTLNSLASKLKVDSRKLTGAVGELSTTFKNHCSSIDLVCPALPEYVGNYNASSAPSSTEPAATDDGGKEPGAQFQHFVEEIREAVESREPTASVITRVMETLAWSLSFDRVLLLLGAQGKKKLLGRMMLGSVEGIDPKSIERPWGAEADIYAPDYLAYKESRPIFNGDPILPDGWPLVAIPIGYGTRSIGVIYADRTSRSSDEISAREQAAIGVLAELLDRSVSMHSK